LSPPAPPVRRSVIERTPAIRQPYAPPPPRKLPRWARWLLLAALLALLLLFVRQVRQPDTLAHSRLAGSRLVTGPICVEEAVDVSGSLARFQAQRQAAEDQLFRFARRALHRDDLFSEAFFARTSQLALPPTPLAALTAPPPEPPLDPDGTYLVPAVRELVRARDTRQQGTCAARALVIITDGLLADDRATLTAALRSGSYTRIFAVIPAATGWGRPGPLTGGALGSVTVYHFDGPGLSGWLASVFGGARPLDVVLGDIVGALTGQELVRS
jgi:hypothetical protein